MESLEVTLRRIRARIDTRINDLLVDTKPNYDDSITGINEAWVIFSKIMKEEIERAGKAT